MKLKPREWNLKSSRNTRKLTKMGEDRPKLYGLMMHYMSVESKDEVAQNPDYATWNAEKDPEKFWQAIIRTHKVDYVCNVDAIKEFTAREDQALDFFHGLDQ
jgi:hypothetical protein